MVEAGRALPGTSNRVDYSAEKEPNRLRQRRFVLEFDYLSSYAGEPRSEEGLRRSSTSGRLMALIVSGLMGGGR